MFYDGTDKILLPHYIHSLFMCLYNHLFSVVATFNPNVTLRIPTQWHTEDTDRNFDLFYGHTVMLIYSALFTVQ